MIWAHPYFKKHRISIGWSQLIRSLTPGSQKAVLMMNCFGAAWIPNSVGWSVLKGRSLFHSTGFEMNLHKSHRVLETWSFCWKTSLYNLSPSFSIWNIFRCWGGPSVHLWQGLLVSLGVPMFFLPHSRHFWFCMEPEKKDSAATIRNVVPKWQVIPNLWEGWWVG